MTKLGIMSVIADFDPCKFGSYITCLDYAKRFRKDELLKVLDVYKTHDPDKVFFTRWCCYFLDDDYYRHYVVNRFI